MRRIKKLFTRKLSNVLVVDDTPENIHSVQRILEDMELGFLKATSGEEALKLLQKYDVALVLMDVSMSGLNGFETVERMRQMENCENIPVIFLTAVNKDEYDIAHGYELGAVDYIVKPIDPEILHTKVDVFLKLHQRQLHLERSLSRLAFRS